ncbi:twin-arginine translocase subunit TatC, partial [Marinobacter sp. 1Y8]
MSLFKRKKSRQEKIAVSDNPALDGIDQDNKATTDSTQNESSDDVLSSLADMPITEHLIELRRHLIKICVAILIIFLGLVGYSRELYNFLSDPLVAQLPANSTMIATDITSNFMAPIRLTVFVAAFLA